MTERLTTPADEAKTEEPQERKGRRKRSPERQAEKPKENEAGQKRRELKETKERNSREAKRLIETIRKQVKRVTNADARLAVLKEQIKGLEETIEDVEVSPVEQGLQEIRGWFARFKEAAHLIDKNTYLRIKESIKQIEGKEDRVAELKENKDSLVRDYTHEKNKRIKALEPLVIDKKQIVSYAQLPETVLRLKGRVADLEKRIDSEREAVARQRLIKELEETKDSLRSVEIHRQAWQEEAGEYVANKVDPNWLARHGEKLRDRRQYIERISQAVEGESPVVAWPRIMEGISRLYGEEIEEPEKLPEILKGALRDWYREQADELAEQLLDKTGWKVPESEAEQRKWLREKVIELRRLGMAPDLIASSSVWLDLVQWLSKKGVKDSVREEFSTRLDLLRFGLRNTQLADPNLSIETIFESAGYLTSAKTVLSVPEIQLAYDLLEERAQGAKRNPKELSPLNVNNSEKKGELIEDLAKEFCRERKLKPTEENLSESSALLGEAFDLYFYLGNLQYMEDSRSRPDSVRKVLDFAGWAKGKFPTEVIESFARARYQAEDGNAISPALGVGARRPYHALFSEFKAEDLIGREGMGFRVSRGRERIFDWRRKECVGVSPETGEKMGGTWIFEKAGMKIEAIIFQQEGQDKKDKKSVIVVGVENPKAAVIAEALSKVREGWFPGYIREIRDGEKTRLVLIDKGLLFNPLGSLSGEMGDVAIKRFLDAGATGDLFATVPPRRYEDMPSPEFVLKNEDMVEAYLEGVLNYSKSKRGREIENYKIWGDYLRSIIIEEVARREMIDKKGEKRLEEEYFGGELMKKIKSGFSHWTVAYRHPLIRAQLISGGVGEFFGMFGNFFKLLLQYALEGTGLEKTFR